MDLYVFPLNWVRITPSSKNTRTMTEKQKEAARMRLKKYHSSRKK